jgi:hypothetical protein
VIAEMSIELPLDESITGIVAPMLERVADPEARQWVLAIGQRLADMASIGYEIGTPARARPATPYTFAKWHVPVTHAGARCVLSFFINETPELTHAHKSGKKRISARCR